MRDGDWRQEFAFRHSVAGPDQLERVNATAGLAINFASSDRAVQLSLEGSQAQTLCIWKTASRSGFLTRPNLEAELLTIRFVDHGAMVRLDRNGKDRVAGAHQVLLVAFDTMRLEHATPGFSSVSATVSRDSLIDAYRAMYGLHGTSLPMVEGVADLGSTGLLSLRATIVGLQRLLANTETGSDLLLPLVQEVLLYQFVASWPLAAERLADRPRSPVDKAVRRAIDFVEGNLAQPISIREIAAAAGLSVRGLQLAFKSHLGCTPVQYLIARRLDRVHLDLMVDDGRSIRTIARRWGFVHLSDFAARYRSRFGHPPSDDRRRNGPTPVA